MSTPIEFYCTACKQHVTVHRRPVNHLKHLFLALFTAGIWLPIWIIVTLESRHICDLCNEPVRPPEPGSQAS